MMHMRNTWEAVLPGLQPQGDSDVTSLWGGKGIHIFQGSPRNSNTQPQLRTPAAPVVLTV